MPPSQNAQANFRKRILIIGGGAVAVFLILAAWNSGVFGASADEHPYAEFAQCLSDEKVVMYGVDWCPNCQQQKKMFGAAFDDVDYVNCDFNDQVCDDQGVRGYPTWKIDERLIGAGVQTFPTLGKVAGCELPEGI